MTPTDQIVGAISQEYSNFHLDQKQQQTKTWADSVRIFKEFYKSSRQHFDLANWGILYEYNIPRRAKRIDAVLLSKNLIFVIEIKNRQSRYNSQDIAQLEDYCLDLRDFHYQSRNRTIIPILLCTEATEVRNELSPSTEQVYKTLFANKDSLADVVQAVFGYFGETDDSEISLLEWNNSQYLPTPTIIEAAEALYAGKNVAEISRYQAGAENLTRTTAAILNAIKQAQKKKLKTICFITGVPGAGKTLAGLNIVHNREFQSEEKELGVFLSGNSPLVKVLSEALSRDFGKREKQSLKEARRKVKTFIQNVHEFIDEYYFDKTRVPIDRVLIYDEAQRAWTKEHKAKKSNGSITESEPEILLSIMSRFTDWAVIIALVGGGQEINTGEAGLRGWGNALETVFSDWNVFISPELKDGDHSTGNLTLFESAPSSLSVFEDESLHLRVSIRSYKAQELSRWVSLVLDGKSVEAKRVLTENMRHYPIVITRNLDVAKAWLSGKARGTRRIGVVASSGGRRLKAIGYDPYYGLRGDSSQDELGAWYLNLPTDVRSSNFLEVIATEYAVQGLELDWAGVFWDADLRRVGDRWDFKQFKGTKWQSVSDSQRRQFILNKYRVLLTRAREGFIIYVPMGSLDDETRKVEFYEQTYEYLKACGVGEIDVCGHRLADG